MSVVSSPMNCGQESAVPGVHQVTGVVVSRHGVEVVHRGHLVLYGDGEVVAVLHQLLDHAVDQLNFGELPLIEKQALSALGQEGVDAQDHRSGGREDGRDPGRHTGCRLERWLRPAVQVALGQPAMSRSRIRAMAISTPVPPRMAVMSS